MLESSWVVVRREVRETSADWRIVSPMLILALLFPIIVVVGIKLGIPFLDRIDPEAATGKVVPFGAMMAAFFPVSFSLVIALESFVGEKERNTLEALLAMPISDTELFLGKLIATLLPPIVLSLAALLIFSLALYGLVGFTIPASFLLLTILLTTIEALVMVAGAVVVSSQATSVRAANLLASFIILPMALAIQAEMMLLLLGYGEALWFILLAFVVLATILVRMGINVFKREEILAHENDQISLGAIKKTFLSLWLSLPSLAIGTPASPPPRFTLRRLYTKDIPQLLAMNWETMAVVALVLIAGGAIGYLFALQHPLPVRLQDLSQLAKQDKTLSGWIEFTTQGIFFHNLRTITLGAVLSLFSFGVAGLLAMLATFFVAGFLTGQATMAGLEPIRFMLAFFLPHGIVEVPASIIAGAFTLRLGMCLMNPPRGFTLGTTLLLSSLNWVKGAALFLPLFLLAAFLEANLTPEVIRYLYGGG